MATETRDRALNTDAPIQNDGAKRLPHERDEAPDGQDRAPRGIMKQAASDLEQGLVDTDLHGQRGAETTVEGKPSGQQAKPQADAQQGMRHHESTAKPRRGA